MLTLERHLPSIPLRLIVENLFPVHHPLEQ